MSLWCCQTKCANPIHAVTILLNLSTLCPPQQLFNYLSSFPPLSLCAYIHSFSSNSPDLNLRKGQMAWLEWPLWNLIQNYLICKPLKFHAALKPIFKLFFLHSRKNVMNELITCQIHINESCCGPPAWETSQGPPPIATLDQPSPYKP